MEQKDFPRGVRRSFQISLSLEELFIFQFMDSGASWIMKFTDLFYKKKSPFYNFVAYKNPTVTCGPPWTSSAVRISLQILLLLAINFVQLLFVDVLDFGLIINGCFKVTELKVQWRKFLMST